MEKDYFDIDGVEGEDVELEEVEAVAEPEPEPEPVPVEAPAPDPMIPLDTHVKSARAGGQYPTEDPGDLTTIWSPNPGVIGSHQQGFRKI